jgi:hypothetical protein
MATTSVDFKDFMLAEYSNIANAHFETRKQVSTYFNYYLLILAAPVVIITLIQNKKIDQIVNATAGENEIIRVVVISILILIALIGMLICWIVIELHHDSILYARVVNGIRNYFYQNQALPVAENEIRVLTKAVDKPDFYSYGHLFVFVIAFAVLNSTFLAAGIYVWSQRVSCLMFIFPSVWLVLHFVLHSLLSKRQTKRYK